MDTAIHKELVKTFIDWATNTSTFSDEAVSTQVRLESSDMELVHEAAAASNHVHGPICAYTMDDPSRVIHGVDPEEFM